PDHAREVHLGHAIGGDQPAVRERTVHAIARADARVSPGVTLVRDWPARPRYLRHAAGLGEARPPGHGRGQKSAARRPSRSACGRTSTRTRLATTRGMKLLALASFVALAAACSATHAPEDSHADTSAIEAQACAGGATCNGTTGLCAPVVA